ncbi:MAG: hypothetical protein J0I91_19185 [Candidatus Accumulibacter sp.]|nr:hypothetical protein [Accumulibacter sp.]
MRPSIKVVLSALRCDPSDCSALLLPDATDHQHSHEAWVPVSALPMLAIGDLWQNGRRLESPVYQLETFQNLRVDDTSASFIKAGLAVDAHFLLPLSRHPWHRLHTQSYCVSLALSDGRRLLVPCVELIRFYFGSSGNLLHRLFTGPLTRESLWVSKRFNPTNRHLHLVLAKRLSLWSAPDIGRIAESPLAWRAAAGIHASCQKAAAQRHPAYPYTGFPFEGQTNLVASGVWLPFGEVERATFLAYRLFSCSHPFPYRSLSYEAADRKVRYASDRKSDQVGKVGHTREKPKGATETTDADPGDRKAQRRIVFENQQRFPDLTRKSIWREKLEAMPKPDVYFRHADGAIEQVALGEPAGSSAVAGIDIGRGNGTESTHVPEQRLPRFVQQGLDRIASEVAALSENSLVKIVCPAGKTAPVFSLPAIVDVDGVLDAELLFTAADGSTRQRRGCFAEVNLKADSPSYWLIAEGSARYVKPVTVPVSTTQMGEAIAALNTRSSTCALAAQTISP